MDLRLLGDKSVLLIIVIQISPKQNFMVCNNKPLNISVQIFIFFRRLIRPGNGMRKKTFEECVEEQLKVDSQRTEKQEQVPYLN